jgi:endonuclease/exonuclease/phosphatase family metal-dependent hydrolase
LTWNCFGSAMNPLAMLRWRGVADAHRLAHPVLRQALQQADVLCMQELWLSEAVELFDGLDHPHKIRDDIAGSWRSLTMSGSGLGVASRLPLEQAEIRAFAARGWGPDRFARKGAVHARVRLAEAPGHELDVITTHVQANVSRRSQAVRARQLRELRQLVDAFGSPDRAVLLCGDLNIDGLAGSRHGEYATLVELFADFEDLGAAADQPTMCPQAALNELAHRYWAGEPLQRLDYALFRPPRGGWLVAEGCERALDDRLPPNGGRATFASDHFGLRVTLRLAAPDADHAA